MPDSDFPKAGARDSEAAVLAVIRAAIPFAVTAILAVPAFACRQRPCLRHRSCALATPAAQPACLSDLDPALRALHAGLQAEALRLLGAITPGIRPPPVEPLSRDPDERELQEAAVAVVQALLPRQGPLRREFQARRRACAALTRPPYAGEDLAQLRDFMRSIGARGIAPGRERTR